MATESRRTVIEPTRVIGPLRTARQLDDDELFRPAHAVLTPAGDDPADDPAGADATSPAPDGCGIAGDDTQVLPRATARRRGWRRARLPVIIAASIGLGFLLALALTARIVVPAGGTGTQAGGQSPSASTNPSATATSAGQNAVAVLRLGDSGAAVTDLQSRLLKIPDVYPDGATNGRYDAVLAAAVARFQLWYGIRGDEEGEYGDATRLDLESRTQG